MRAIVCVLVGAAVVLGCSATADALPRFALMAGAKCASCHVNPTGGQMRNDYGLTFGMDALPMRTASGAAPQEDGEEAFTFNPKLSENISIGADYRSQFIYDQESQTSTFHMMTMSLYGAVRLQKTLTFFFKQDLVNPAYDFMSGPELFLVAKVLPGGWYVKGGDFLPDYGWRLDDHSSYIRGGDLGFLPGVPGHNGLIFLPNYKDIGVEIGGQSGAFFISAGLFNASGNNKKLNFERDKAYAAKVEYSGAVAALSVRIGVSGYGYRSFKMGGVHLGVGNSDFALLGEVDLTHNTLDPFSVPGPGAIDQSGRALAAFGELDVRAMQGLWLTGKFDIFDPARGVADNELKRLTLGLEVFPLPFVEIRPQYRVALGSPSVDNNQGLVQMHVWF